MSNVTGSLLQNESQYYHYHHYHRVIIISVIMFQPSSSSCNHYHYQYQLINDVEVIARNVHNSYRLQFLYQHNYVHYLKPGADTKGGQEGTVPPKFSTRGTVPLKVFIAVALLMEIFENK